MTPQQLKNSILQRAIEGRLVEQRPEEGTAKDLLREIRAEKARLIEEGKIKKSKPLPPITEDEKPFEIPEGWEWVRFDEFGVYKKGPFGSSLTKSLFIPKGIDTVKVYEQKNAIQKDATLGSYYISKKYFEEHMTGFEVNAGDVIVSCAGTIGETYILPANCEKGIINQALMRMRLMPSVYIPFFLLYFDSILKNTARKSSKGSALKNIPPFSELKIYLVPLPPLSEQHRIVSKIEELLPLIDKYDKAYTKLTDYNARFPEAMKKSILQYAIQGKLVEQRPEEGTAKDLLTEIRTEKERLIEEGKIKKSKPLPPITEDEKPFGIPEGWTWVRLGQIFTMQAGKNIKASCIYDIQDNEHGYLCYGGNGVRGYVATYNRDGTYPLIGRQGALCGNIHLANGKFYATEHAVVTETYAGTDVEWAKYFLIALNLNQYATATAQPGIAVNKIEVVLIPLPPLAEQHRIVSKIEELLPLCEKLVK